MKKSLSFILALLLVLTGVTSAFAAEANVTVPSDVKGSTYETAVTELMQKGIVSGYPDGTFRPDSNVNRAEAVIMAVKSMEVSESDLNKASGSGFSDLTGYNWAASYINYAAGEKVVSGYPDGTFRPSGEVTVIEMAAMLVNSLGYTTKDLTGTWPENYLSKATELGLFKGLAAVTKETGSTPASRGTVAVMIYNALSAAKASTGDKTPEQTTEPAVKPDPDGDKTSTSSAVIDGNGNYYGMIEGLPMVLDKDGKKQQGVSFRMGNKFGDVVCESSSVISGINSADYEKGQLYKLRARSGEIRAIDKVVPAGGSNTDYSEIATGGTYTTVTAISGNNVQINGDYYSLAEKLVVYVVNFDKDDQFDGYKIGSKSSITKNSMVRAYDVMDDKTTEINVIVVVKSGDVSKL